MNLNGKLRKKLGDPNGGPSQNLGGSGPPSPPLESPLFLIIGDHPGQMLAYLMTDVSSVYFENDVFNLTCINIVLREVIASYWAY